MEWFNKLIDNIANILQTKIDFLEVGAYSPAFYIAVGGIALILVAFIVALIARGFSKNKKFQKSLEDNTAYTNALGMVDEDNIGELNSRIQTMSAPIVKGWGYFLEQQMGYPSDYMTEKDVFYSNKKQKYGAKKFFNFISAIVILVGIAAAAISCKDMFNNISAEKGTLIALSIGGALAGPLLVYVILSAILSAGYSRREKKLKAAFCAFQDALDNTVIIFREEQDEFISENIEEINATIEEILANKLDSREIIEIVTTPIADGDDAEYEDEISVVSTPAPVEQEPIAIVEKVEEQPAPTIEESVVATVMTEEEIRKGERLVELVLISSRASKDKDITSEQILELSQLIFDAKNSGDYPDRDEQEIFDECLRILSARYYN